MRKKKQNSIFNLIFLCFITTMLVTTLSLSRYQSTVTGNANAEVAKFDIKTQANVNTALQLDYSDVNTQTAHYAFSISNESEVKVSYDLTIELPAEWPNTIYMSLFQKVGNTNNEIAATSKVGNIYTYTNSFNISQTKEEHEYILTFGFNGTLDNDKFLEGIKILVTAQQND